MWSCRTSISVRSSAFCSTHYIDIVSMKVFHVDPCQALTSLCRCWSPRGQFALSVRSVCCFWPLHSHRTAPAIVRHSWKRARVDQLIHPRTLPASRLQRSAFGPHGAPVWSSAGLFLARCCFCYIPLSCSTSSHVLVTRTPTTLKCTSVLRPRRHRPLFSASSPASSRSTPGSQTPVY